MMKSDKFFACSRSHRLVNLQLVPPRPNATSGGCLDAGSDCRVDSREVLPPTTLKLDGTTPGNVAIRGAVTLGTNTTTEMNYHGASNTAGQLVILDSVFTLAGTLFLNSLDNKK